MNGIHIHQFRKACRQLWGGRWCTALAREMDVHPNFVFDIESGHREIPDEALSILKIAIENRIEGLRSTLAELSKSEAF